jgi:hypothetical protein
VVELIQWPKEERVDRMAVDLVVSCVLRQHHVGVGIVAGEVQLVVVQPPGSYVTMACHGEPSPMSIDEQGVECAENED